MKNVYFDPFCIVDRQWHNNPQISPTSSHPLPHGHMHSKLPMGPPRCSAPADYDTLDCVHTPSSLCGFLLLVTWLLWASATAPLSFLDLTPESNWTRVASGPHVPPNHKIFMVWYTANRWEGCQDLALLRRRLHINRQHAVPHLHSLRFQASGQLVLPQNLKKQVLESHHDSILGGHLGASDSYGWYDINDYVSTCNSCNQEWTQTIKHPSPLEILPQAWVRMSLFWMWLKAWGYLT